MQQQEGQARIAIEREKAQADAPTSSGGGNRSADRAREGRTKFRLIAKGAQRHSARNVQGQQASGTAAARGCAAACDRQNVATGSDIAGRSGSARTRFPHRQSDIYVT
jgi:hypothetical protein